MNASFEKCHAMTRKTARLLSMDADSAVRCYVYLTLLMVYIAPVGLAFGPFNSAQNHIFTVVVCFIYLVSKIHDKFNPLIILLWESIIVIAAYTGKFGFIDFAIIPIVGELIKHRKCVIQTILKGNLLYYCIIFSALYSVIFPYIGVGGRGEGSLGSGVVFTAIGEINLSGLSLFCLGLLTLKKNQYIGIAVLAFGMLTLSRSYLLALACFFLFDRSALKRFVSRHLRLFTYLNLTLISVVFLYCLGLVEIALYHDGDIIAHSTNAGFLRLFSFNDYSNYYRFLANYLVVAIMCANPVFMLKGMSNANYFFFGSAISGFKGISFTGIGPHNIFFSHLKLYGIWVFIEILLVSKYLKRIVSADNFGIYMAIFLYGVILGTGLYNYWLFLSAITLILYEAA